MSPTGGLWAAVAWRGLGRKLAHTTRVMRAHVSVATRAVRGAEVRSALVRTQPVHPMAGLRQQKSHTAWYLARSYFSSTSGSARHASRVVISRASAYSASATGRSVARFVGRAPFASTLRPNLTGGVLPRTAGGYASPGMGRVRYFSHAPTSQAHLVQNVSQAVRAFWASGQRAHYDGIDARTGRPRYLAVGATTEESRGRLDRGVKAHAPGSFLDFAVSPTVTALSPLGLAPSVGEERADAAMASLCADGFLNVLAVDFARSLKDLAAVMADLKKLARLGDLPVVMEKGNTVLRVRFPGLDAAAVLRLCDDVGVSRGLVGQDADFDASAGVHVALRYPYAPDETCDKTLTSPEGSMRSHDSELSDMEEDDALLDQFEEHHALLSGVNNVGYGNMSDSFEGLEGIHRFLEECDRVRGRFGTGLRG